MDAARCEQPQALEEIAETYRLLARRLEHIVRAGVPVSDALVEEACQAAWGRLLDHRESIRSDCALSWLTTTAVREALKLQRRERRQLSLDAAIDRDGDGALGLVPGPQTAVPALGPETLVERRERLAALGALPRRQQRLLWLRALGLSYAEISRQTGDSTRTVERQLLRARQRLKAVAA